MASVEETRFTVRILSETAGRPHALVREDMCHLLEDAADPFEVDEDTVTVSQIVQAPYEEPVTSVQAAVYSMEEDCDLRFAAEELALQWCDVSACGMETQGRLQILDKEAFFNCCIANHRGICLNSLKLGNFLNWGTFLEHYVEELIDDGGYFAGEGIFADFEHDRKQLIVKFKDTTNWTREIGYKLVFSYSSIHSIVVDTSETNHQGLSLYLQLRWPPQVFKKFPPQPRDNVQSGRRNQPPPSKVDLDKYYDWFRVTEFAGCTKEILGECPTICLPIYFPGSSRESRHDKKFFEILGRLKTRTKQSINFSAVKHIPYWTNQTIDHIPELTFPAQYALSALFSRGFIVKDQVLMCARQRENGGTWNIFLKKVQECSHKNPEATERALDQLLAAVDERKNVSLLRAFDFLFRVQTDTQMTITAGDVGGALEPVDLPGGCVLIRKILITPTRVVYLPVEVQMVNRVVRTFGEDCALRVGFRDDDGRKLVIQGFQPSRYQADIEDDEGEGILDQMIRGTLQDGIRIGNRHYRFLAWSNSQMRDHGCYMYSRTKNKDTHEEVEVEQIRHWMGEFAAIQNVPKLMSRMGQCFTQARVGLKLEEEHWRVANDVIGGERNPEVEHKIEYYTFSDGIGRISMAAAKKVCNKLDELSYMPSAYQVRFAGCKGMLSVDPQMDEENARNETQILAEFRDSMQKFKAIQTKDLEIVKYSMQSPVFLNRPLIMILDQVSAKQGQECHARVTHRLHRLLENELFLMADMLCSEKDSVIALKDRIPMGMDFPKLRLYGFSMTTEPFFRGLLLAVHRYNIKEQLAKAKVVIPNHLGRTLYGVMDETGLLKYGQVFIQYSASIKKDKCQHKKLIHMGKVMVTKNPCIVPGDVRIFEAVDLQELHHHCDVIVFPQNGPRPHPDEMAGSDLDGDEYAVYFDQQMMFNTNEKAMTFPKSEPEEIAGGVKTEHMVDFFLKFMRMNSIGYVSNAHLVMSDQRGIFNEICMEIARECSKAVDFPKTGNPAQKLTREQQPYKYPDYFEKDNKPSYRSKWMLGQIFRKTKKVEEILEVGSLSLTVEVDPDLYTEGWEAYEKKAKETRDLYCSHLQSLMDTYGITDEASLVSGHMITVRNRISEQEKEDFSFYNTEKLVELRYGKIFSQFRKEFFKEFGGEENIDLESPQEFLQEKAYAWYLVTYGQRSNRDAVVTRCLSFPWIVWDILAYIKRDKVLEKGYDELIQFDPIREQLGKVIDFEAERKETEFQAKIGELMGKNDVIERYCLRYKDIWQLFCIITEWAKNDGVFVRSALRDEDVCMLMLMFGLGLLHEEENDSKRVDEDDCDENMNRLVTVTTRGLAYVSEKLESVDEAKKRNTENGQLQLGFQKGCFLLDFVKYCGMTAFRRLPELNFAPIGCDKKMQTSEGYLLNQAAFKTYHRIALTGTFEALSIGEGKTSRPEMTKDSRWDVDEFDPIMIDLCDPRLMINLESDRDIEKMLKCWSGCEEVRLSRDMIGNKYEQVRVLARGTLESRHKLRCYITADNLQDHLEEGIPPPDAQDF